MSDDRSCPTRAPHRNLETAAFWDGCAAGRLVLPRCDDCGELIWYPRRFCPFCGSLAVDRHRVSGRGTVYSFTVIRGRRAVPRRRRPTCWPSSSSTRARR